MQHFTANATAIDCHRFAKKVVSFALHTWPVFNRGAEENQVRYRKEKIVFGMKKAALLLILICGGFLVQAQEQVLLEDQFADNHRTWPQSNDDKTYAAVEDGVYRLERRQMESSDVFLLHLDEFETHRDHTVSAELTQSFGHNADGFGLVWGALDKGNYHAYLINSDGEYRIVRYKDFEEREIRAFTHAEGVLKPQGQPNRLTFRKLGEIMTFYANGKYLHSIPAQRLSGNKIGFVINRKMEIAVDNFIVQQNPPMTEVFADSFDDDAQRWRVTPVDSQISILRNGKLYIRPQEGQKATFLTHDILLNTARDFEFEAIMRSISGSPNRGYGIVWGAEDALHSYIFMIKDFGSYAVFKRNGSSVDKLVDWTSSGQSLGLRNNANKLLVRKSGDELELFLNDIWLAQLPFNGFLGKRAGFVLQGDLKIAIDQFVVREGERRIEKPPVAVASTPEKEIREVKTAPATPATAPVIALLKPASGNITIDQKSVAIKAGIKSDSKLNGIRLLVNDKQVPMQARRDASGEYDLVIDQEFELENGVNEIRLMARNADGMVKRKTISVSVKLPEKPIERNGNDYALFFATNEYAEWSDLTNPINDARTMARELEQNYGFNTELVIEEDKRNILKKLKEYARRDFDPNDQLLIFFAGHGKFDADFGEGYVVCTDSRKNDEGNESYISHSSLRTIVNNIPSKHTFLVMDVCFGGTIDPFIASGGNRGELNGGIQEITPTEFIERKLKFKTRKYLTSGGKEYVPDGTPGAHSPFTRKFLEALRSYGGEDQIITLAELLLYFERLVPEPRFGEYGSNEPGSDFLFIAR